ncbi:MAG: hypothetical protein JRI23_27685 [Deltaproteobacteria bacterium]|nr:hypothetical protein [Deltaproteobacteria bacterium]MBW2535863.1 hypothetical protein [Deltaproteobacteria bacterium]
MGDARGAFQVLAAAIVRFGEDADLLELHCNALARLGFRRAAEGAYIAALEHDPDRLSALLELGRVRVDLELHAGALSPLERRIALGGGDAETYRLTARALRGCRRFDEAYAAYERAFSTRGGADDVPLQCLLGAARMYELPRVRRRVARAAELSRRWLERVVERDPCNDEAQRLLALVLADIESASLARAGGEGKD